KKIADDKKSFLNPENIMSLSDLIDHLLKDFESNKDLVLDISVDENALDEENRKLQESLQTLQGLRLKAIDNEYERRREQINQEYDYLLEKFSEFDQVRREIEASRIRDLAELESDMYNRALSEAINIGQQVQNIFGL